MVKTWGKQAAPDRQLLLKRVLAAADDPDTLQTVHEDVGPRPTVSVSLRVPGSYVYGSSVGPLDDVDLTIVYRGSSPVADDLEYVTRALTPDVAFPSPAVVLQARRNAEARTALLEEFGALSATDVAELAGSTAKNTSALAGRWRRDGRILAVEHHGASLYPGFQFTDTGQPRPVVEASINYLQRTAPLRGSRRFGLSARTVGWMVVDRSTRSPRIRNRLSELPLRQFESQLVRSLWFRYHHRTSIRSLKRGPQGDLLFVVTGASTTSVSSIRRRAQRVSVRSSSPGWSFPRSTARKTCGALRPKRCSTRCQFAVRTGGSAQRDRAMGLERGRAIAGPSSGFVARSRFEARRGHPRRADRGRRRALRGDTSLGGCSVQRRGRARRALLAVPTTQRLARGDAVRHPGSRSRS